MDDQTKKQEPLQQVSPEGIKTAKKITRAEALKRISYLMTGAVGMGLGLSGCGGGSSTGGEVEGVSYYCLYNYCSTWYNKYMSTFYTSFYTSMR